MLQLWNPLHGMMLCQSFGVPLRKPGWKFCMNDPFNKAGIHNRGHVLLTRYTSSLPGKALLEENTDGEKKVCLRGLVINEESTEYRFEQLICQMPLYLDNRVHPVHETGSGPGSLVCSALGRTGNAVHMELMVCSTKTMPWKAYSLNTWLTGC